MWRGVSHCDLPLSQSHLLPCGFSPLKKCLETMSADCRLWKATLGHATWTMQVLTQYWSPWLQYSGVQNGVRVPVMAGLEADGSLSVISVGRRVLNAPSLGKAPSRHALIAVITHWEWR